jgi:hypothetical protein
MIELRTICDIALLKAGRARAALLLGAFGMSVLSPLCHAIEPEPLKTDRIFILGIRSSLAWDFDGSYGGIRSVRLGVLTAWPRDMGINPAKAVQSFSRGRSTSWSCACRSWE